MTKNRMTIQELVDSFMTELRTNLPTDFPVGRWGERAIKYASEQYYAFGRKGSYRGYAKAIYDAMKACGQGTVHSDYAAEWIAGKVESNCCYFDNFCREL